MVRAGNAGPVRAGFDCEDNKESEDLVAFQDFQFGLLTWRRPGLKWGRVVGKPPLVGGSYELPIGRMGGEKGGGLGKTVSEGRD